MQLSIIVPCKRRNDPQLEGFLASVKQQTFAEYEVLIETEGNSEEAKCHGILKDQGDILGFFCADNDLRDRHFLREMVWYASQPQVTGAYTAQYDYVPTDKPLSRYFALLGANDPLCWWLGKADRRSYLENGCTMARSFTPMERLPSLGDNGCFLKRALVLQTHPRPEVFGSCMCLCEDLRRLGHATYWVVAEQKLWHRTGEDFWGYFRRRWRYVNDLYFARFSTRRWVMVQTRRDWWGVLTFMLASLSFLPQVFVAGYGYFRVRDRVWVLHPVVCWLLTWLYGVAWLKDCWTQGWDSTLHAFTWHGWGVECEQCRKYGWRYRY